MLETFLTIYVSSQLLALGVAFYVHLSICWVTARTYRKAYKIDPTNKRWPGWYTDSRWMWIVHFWRGFIRPWETIPRWGVRMESSLVAFDFARAYPSGKVIAKKDKIVVDNILP